MNTTLDQWEVLEAVVQLGSFAAAASMMNRSQSTISYAISHLQEQFKVPLLEMKGRKAYLTEAGKALLADVEPLLTGFRALERRAASLATGGDSQIRLSVDSLYPNERLFTAVTELTRAYPPRASAGSQGSISVVHPRIHDLRSRLVCLRAYGPRTFRQAHPGHSHSRSRQARSSSAHWNPATDADGSDSASCRDH